MTDTTPFPDSSCTHALTQPTSRAKTGPPRKCPTHPMILYKAGPPSQRRAEGVQRSQDSSDHKRRPAKRGPPSRPIARLCPLPPPLSAHPPLTDSVEHRRSSELEGPARHHRRRRPRNVHRPRQPVRRAGCHGLERPEETVPLLPQAGLAVEKKFKLDDNADRQSK